MNLDILQGKSKQVQSFLTVFLQCLTMQTIDASFFLYVTELYQDLSPMEKTEYEQIYKHFETKLHRGSSTATKNLKDQYRLPTQIFHSKYSLSIQTNAELEVYANLIEPLQFPSLHPPKKLFLLYGMDNNGKTSLVNNIFRSLEKLKPSLLHLRDDGLIWSQHFNFQNRQEQFNLLINYFKNILITNPECWILFEFEHFDEIISDDINHFFEKLIQLERVILFASTSKPSKCDSVFSKLGHTHLVFVDLPNVQTIAELLILNIFKFIKEGNINTANSPFISISNELKELLTEEIAPQLVCRPSKYTYSKSALLRKCCKDAKKQYGITMGELNMNLIPTFLKCLSSARKNWYNTEEKCFYKLPLIESACSATNPTTTTTIPKEIIYKESSLTKEELILLHKGKLQCEVLQRPVLCQDTNSLYVDWKWIKEARLSVFDIVRQCLTDVKENEEENRLYEELLRFYDSH